MNLPWLGEQWHWQNPELLWLGLVVPIGLLVRVLRRPTAKPFAPYPFVPHLPHSLRQRSRFFPLLLQGLGLLLLVAALARPQQRQRVLQEKEGIEVLLCLDQSSSMAATDLDPQQELTRLEIAKQAAKLFVEGRDQDRLGLFGFARDARLLCPLTLDHPSLLELLAELETVPVGREDDATGIGTALASAGVSLRDREATSRLIILLTDGEETVATSSRGLAIRPQEAATLCRDWGVRIHTISTGPDALAGRASLQGVARIAGGQAFAAQDAQALAEVYRAIDELERTRFTRLPWQDVDRYRLFLLTGLGFWVLGMWSRKLWWEARS